MPNKKTICQTKNTLTAEVLQNLIKQQIGIKMLQNSKVLSAINTKGTLLYQMRNQNSSVVAEVT